VKRNKQSKDLKKNQGSQSFHKIIILAISSTLYAFTWSFFGKKVLQYQKEHFLITMIVEWKLCLGPE
jgi:hypothetical protein